MNKTIRCRRNAGDDGGCGGMDWYGMVADSRELENVGRFRLLPKMNQFSLNEK